jgi:hypothetical protein
MAFTDQAREVNIALQEHGEYIDEVDEDVRAMLAQIPTATEHVLATITATLAKIQGIHHGYYDEAKQVADRLDGEAEDLAEHLKTDLESRDQIEEELNEFYYETHAYVRYVRQRVDATLQLVEVCQHAIELRRRVIHERVHMASMFRSRNPSRVSALMNTFNLSGFYPNASRSLATKWVARRAAPPSIVRNKRRTKSANHKKSRSHTRKHSY